MTRQVIKTGVLGGTFDPVHRGHLAMALAALQEYDLDEVWIMPNGSPPHKNDRLITATPKERLEMVVHAIDDINHELGHDAHLVACDYEVRRRKTSYSYETMESFNKLYPERDFYFIIGEDSLHDLYKWMKPDRLLRTCVLLVAVRGDDNIERVKESILRYKSFYEICDIRLITMEHIDISSTMIREQIAEGADISSFVTPSVATYIASHPTIYKHLKAEAGE